MERLPRRTTKAGPLSVDPHLIPRGTCSCSPAFRLLGRRQIQDEKDDTRQTTANQEELSGDLSPGQGVADF